MSLELNIASRRPQGCYASPYPISFLFRYALNYISNGRFFQPDLKLLDSSRLLHREGSLATGAPLSGRPIKLLFLGDVMLTKSGQFPLIDAALKAILASADIIIFNLESPLSEEGITKRSPLSLNFKMHSAYLKNLYACNAKAKWVFNIANNHACDTSASGAIDHGGIEKTVQIIKRDYPEAEVVGASVKNSHTLLSLQVADGPKIGFVAWTEWMNHDARHYQKRIVREAQIPESVRKEHDYMIGLAHANVEQAPHPLAETAAKWRKLVPAAFDLIIGTGPHVVQPAERSGETGMIFHSLGNFVSAGGKSQTKIGLVPEITLHQTQNKKVAKIDYQMHFVEQQQEHRVVLKPLDSKNRVINRLKVLWPTLFSSTDSKNNLRPYHSRIFIEKLQLNIYQKIEVSGRVKMLSLPLAVCMAILEPLKALSMLIESVVLAIFNLMLLRFSHATFCLVMIVLNGFSLALSPLKSLREFIHHIDLLRSPEKAAHLMSRRRLSLFQTRANAAL